jgi:hexosaminidase
MKYLKFMPLCLFSLFSLLGCKANEGEPLDIIPKPVSAKTFEGFFTLSSATPVLYNFDFEMGSLLIETLTNHLSDYYKIEGSAATYSAKQSKGSVFLKLNPDAKVHNEGYKLKVNKRGVVLEAKELSGLFYGVQSLIQMMPAESGAYESIEIPFAVVEDYPRFSWRGLHLDVCRHFMPKEFIFKYLDFMAMHKLNTFHFHLTEDQGWRIEIKKYPLLTEVGSKRKETIVGHGRSSKEYDGTPHGGFYTQEDIKEIVKYAAERHITVVPEIEMPGHALAALASYPHLGCTGGPYEVATKWGVFHDVMCAGKESTFEFLENVLAEVLELFPSEYIHIGGDECPKTKWKECPLCQQRIKDEGLKDEHELQSYFIQRMERYLNSKGRKLIGWDEILEGGLAPNAAVMSWRGEAGGIEAAKQKHNVVMSPGSHCYLDHYQADPKTEPLAIGGFTPLDKIYSYEPVPDSLSVEESAYIMGAQGNVWTEYMKTSDHVEYMVYPRAAALAEVVWSPKAERSYAEFLDRLRKLARRYEYYGLNYSRVEFMK